MKTKYLLLGIAALFVAGGLWAGRAGGRGHHKLVTLDVREAPLAEVLRKVERQTWTKLRAEKALDARITLQVKDKPLAYVLKRIGDQAGARWSRLYAVYGSTRSLSALDSALAGEGKIEAAGWMKIAPNPRPMDQPAPKEGGPAFEPNPNPGDSGSASGQRGMMASKRTPVGTAVFPAGANDQMETWPPSRLVIESSLSGRLGGEAEPDATAAAAARTALKVNGRWTTYLALTQLPKGIRFGGGGFGGGFGGGGGFRGAPPPGFDPSKLVQNNKLGPDDRFLRLTPEQRVQRARELRELRERLARQGR